MKKDFAIFSNIQDCIDEWSYLEKRCETDIFQNYNWIKGWIENEIDLKCSKLFIMVFYRHGNPFFLAPLYIVRQYFYSELRYMGDPLNDYNQPIIDQNANISWELSNSIWKKIFKESNCDLINLSREKNNLSKFASESLLNGYYNDVLFDWDIFYKNKKSKKSRYNLNRQEKLLARAGDLKYRIIDDNDITHFLKKMIEFKSAFYKRNKIKNIFISNKFKKNFINFCNFLNINKLLSVYCLYLNNDIIAIHVGYKYNKMYYYIFPSYDNNYKEYSPGILLQKFIMKDVFSNNFNKFDFTVGNEEYKLSWSNNKVTLFETVKFMSTKGLVVYLFILFKKYFKKFL